MPAGSPAALDGIAFVAQDTPLYRNLSAADMLHMTRNLNRRFDEAYAKARLGELGIPLERKAGKLSGGQQAQLALTLALARRPQLLVLDEPMAMLDPLARHDFMATVMTAIADDGVSVVLSSHVLAELERVADYLVLMSGGSVQVAGEVDDLLAGHRVLTGPAAEAGEYTQRLNVVHARRGEAQAHLLVRTNGVDRACAARLGGAPGEPGRADPRVHARSSRRGAAWPGARGRSTAGGEELSTATMPTRARHDASLRPLPWRRMAWVTWRQHRLTLAGVVALLGAAGAYLLITGLPMHDGLRRRDRLPPDRFAHLPAGGQQFLEHLCARRRDRPRALAGDPGAHRSVRRRAGAGQGTGDRHVPLRVDSGLRSDTLDSRQAGAARGRGHGRRRSVQRARLVVRPADPRRGRQQRPAVSNALRPARDCARRLDAGSVRDWHPEPASSSAVSSPQCSPPSPRGPGLPS